MTRRGPIASAGHGRRLGSPRNVCWPFVASHPSGTTILTLPAPERITTTRPMWESGGGSRLLETTPNWAGAYVVVWARVDLGFEAFYSHPLVLGRIPAEGRGAWRPWQYFSPAHWRASENHNNVSPLNPSPPKGSRPTRESIHQICCTHCTYGSSALERREGELANRTLGYSARAGSIEARGTAQGLPAGGARSLLLSSPRYPGRRKAVALRPPPCRGGWCYLPAVRAAGKSSAQVCYRPTDSEGRPGSYFAHVLLGDAAAGGPRWPALTCLRLAGARLDGRRLPPFLSCCPP